MSDLCEVEWSASQKGPAQAIVIQVAEIVLCSSLLSEAKNPSWFKTKDEGGFFARRGGLRMTVPGIFLRRV